MVLYGEWVESHVHRNYILPFRPDGGPEVVLGDPLRDAESGWEFADVSLQRADGFKAIPGNDPAGASEPAWVTARASTLVNVTGTGGDATRQSLIVGYNATFDQTTATWLLYVWSHTMQLKRFLGWNGPAPELWPEGAVGVEIDSPGHREILSVVASGHTPGSAYFRGYVKDVGAADDGWLSTVDGTAGFPELPPGSESGGQGYAFDATALQELAAELKAGATGSDRYFFDRRMPRFAFAPSNPVSKVSNVDVSYAPSFQIVIDFLGPRHRYIFDTPPEPPRPVTSPPRRIFPRDDGLTGGARRTFPPSKSQQWGRRVDGSGYA